MAVQPRGCGRLPSDHRCWPAPWPRAWELGHPLGAGITGPGAHDFLRAVPVEPLTADSAQIQVIITRKELNLPSGEAFDPDLQQPLSPPLRGDEYSQPL